ncbi:hypothetical protein SanaruYs_06610 [Chryseotalea sanaruensis]|uniref:BZIP transcription factor n=1 Tax=Chryseotalea sanaruensis TaxID=2482724 RepID=A0A401U6M2_9BACT|nr:hypothetical protein [Chryseotalea sanaruensis]GCC50446.1 hypothetical protein SanaruYs_06610 [Chryseotalea sanaruensis]
MKNLLISFMLTACSFVVHAQWNTSVTNTLHTNSGNVGIGVDPPLEKLHINGAIRGNAGGGALRINTPTGYVDIGSANTAWMHFRTDRPRFYFDKPVTVFGGIGSYDLNDLYLQTNTSTRMTIVNSTGDVGINTTAPQGKFQVNTERPVIIKSNGGNGIYGSEIGFNAVVNTAVVPNQFRKLGGTSQQGGASIAVDHTGNMLFQMYNGATLDESITNYLPQIVFKNDGKLGVGTTSPTANLQIGQSTMNGLISMGGYAHIGSLKSSGDLFLGMNVQAKYLDVSDNSVVRVLNSNNHGFSTIQMSYNGDVTFYAKKGSVIANEQANTNGNAVLKIVGSGNVGIGTTNPDAKLAVKGTIHAEEVKVDLQVPGPDYVFEPTYQLPSLIEIENYIKTNKHLPEVPSAKEMETNGINLSEMNMLLLKKVEELTLYMIKTSKQVEELKVENKELKKSIEFLNRKD